MFLVGMTRLRSINDGVERPEEAECKKYSEGDAEGSVKSDKNGVRGELLRISRMYHINNRFTCL